MKNSQKSLFLVFPAFVIGVVIGLYLIVIAGWADMESAFYGFSHSGDVGLQGFSCPILMTSNETGTISLKVTNPTDNLLRPSIKVEISTPSLPEESLENIELAPGESKLLTWSVGPKNIDLRNFIFAEALMYSVYPLPSQGITCGIFIVNLPGSGKVILSFLVVVGLLGMGWGLYGMRKVSDGWVEKYFRALAFLAGIIVLGVIVSFVVGWVPSLIILAVAVLMIFTLLGSFLLSGRKK